jgi:predicted dehydrogenase
VKQVTHRPRDGLVSVVDVPIPALKSRYALVATRYSLISAGTERSKVELGNKSLIQKARSRPDLAKKVVDRARVEGARSAISAARERLGTLAPLGYSAAGVVIQVGHDVEGIGPGDHVACGGAWANHAEVLSVPRNLLALVPESVDLADAAYATVGSIALHAVRQADASIGECVGVIGLGLVGQLAVRLLVSAGCRVVGIDLDPAAVELARAAASDAFHRNDEALESAVARASGGFGLDAVLVCAATRSRDPLELAARLARDRGRLVVVGDVPVEADRAVLYEKELELRLSRSYGPGRYDRDYEERGRDLPVGYVRWTEQRNIQAFVDLLAAGKLDLAGLTTHRFSIEQAAEAYEVLTSGEEPRPFGVLLEYAHEQPSAPRPRAAAARMARAHHVRVGLIGAGAFARQTLLPALRAGGAELVAVASSGGLSAADAASRFGFERAASSADEIFGDESIGAVVIATRHQEHAALAAAALHAGKSVLVEKPLALDQDGLIKVQDALAETSGILMVGFNRRYAPFTVELRDRLAAVGGAAAVNIRVNAGPLPADHWLNDPEDGGGRLLGEACHFVDLISDLTAPITSVFAAGVARPGFATEMTDTFTATLHLADGAVGSLLYTGDGDPRLRKERIEAFGGGIAAVIDDYRRLEVFLRGKLKTENAKQDKGHRQQMAVFLAATAGELEPPDPVSYVATTRATLAIAESLRTLSYVDLR